MVSSRSSYTEDAGAQGSHQYAHACHGGKATAFPCRLCNFCRLLTACLKPSSALLLGHDQHLVVYKTFWQLLGPQAASCWNSALKPIFCRTCSSPAPLLASAELSMSFQSTSDRSNVRQVCTNPGVF